LYGYINFKLISMFLEKLEIQGLKSFANKNVLMFPGMINGTKRGITAIVGPNGSGKSNVADAVRWVLGEQSMKTLRGKKSEDIIFSGSDKKGKLGMAEVSMHLNNEDNKAPIDYSQIVITRRLYRNGDSEYMLNNNRVRLSDIQLLLAKAKFGQKTYSVIGQGMVEGFLNTSLAERKEFFDEATGVKQYQIKRDEALNKLRASHENLTQGHMLLVEIEPRLKSLTRQVNRLQKRGELEGKLKEAQTSYYSKIWHEINDKFIDYNNRFLELEKEKNIKDKKMEQLNRDLGKMEEESTRDNEFYSWQEKLSLAQAEKDRIQMSLARLDARLEMKLESQGNFDLSYLMRKKEEIILNIERSNKEVSSLESEIGIAEESARSIIAEKSNIDSKIAEANRSLMQAVQQPVEIDDKNIDQRLRAILDDLHKAENEDDPVKLKELFMKIKNELEDIAGVENESRAAMREDKIREREEIQKIIRELAAEKEEILNDINEKKLHISSRRERLRMILEKKRENEKESNMLEEKIKKAGNKVDFGQLEEDRKKLSQELEIALKELEGVRTKMNELNAVQEQKRSRVFSLQREMQSMQNEINLLSLKLNDLKINSTRYETKLEDLELEIREELGGLKTIKEAVLEDVNAGALKQEISSLKKHLEMIGGIDPEVENEYVSTKERFDFLSGQINDFSETVKSLEKIIKELDGRIKEQFDKEFSIIAMKFEQYFKILFNGGSAKIIKVMESASENEEESEEGADKKPVDMDDLKKIKFLQKHNATGLAGIEIQATPPGKKIKSISMLSGGERALTAIALICAIISANPSPFVVLDEVDAALDEANSERLAKILDELSHKTQFIVITHNRASMRRANILYGVTMGDDGASKLLSVKLDQVKVGR
jgi:chromosome segregation protein